MTGATHVVLAATATLILGQQSGHMPQGALAWGIVLGAALIPDIDEPRSTASNPAGLFNKLMPRWVQNFLNTPFQAISSSLRSVFGHRGATHYLIWPLVCGAIGWYYSLTMLWWLAWGYLLHLLADWVTQMGIPAFGPFRRRNFSILPKPLRIKTGGPVETLINTICWLYLLYAVYVYF